MSDRRHAVIDSPLGKLTLVAEGEALCALYLDVHRHRPEDADRFGDLVTPPDGVLATAAAQLDEYFAGTRVAFDVPLALHGTPFQQQVWKGLPAIPYGETRSYGQLAAAVGSPGASRAVGLANGRNPVSIIVPCHRVIGADGSLTGYGGGLENKQLLLDHERRTAGGVATLF